MLYRSETAYHDIKPAKQLDGLVDGSLDVRLLAHIRPDPRRLDLREALRDGLRGLLDRGDVHVDEQDVRALLCEEQGRLEADASTSRVRALESARDEGREMRHTSRRL